MCQRQQGHNDATFDLLRHCIEIDSTRSEAYYFLAQYYAHLKDKQRVVQYYRKAARLEPDNTTYLETLANALLNQRQCDPLNIGPHFQATKAFHPDNNSFDDRTYIRFKV